MTLLGAAFEWLDKHWLVVPILVILNMAVLMSAGWWLELPDCASDDEPDNYPWFSC